jgi:uncharacterized damage-inducible protein DinB
MRSRALLLVIASAVVLVPHSGAHAAELSRLERSRLVAHLEMTGAWLIDEVSNLSQEQLEFRPAAGSWSILEVLEHIVVVGPIYWNDLQKALASKPGKPRSISSDADMLWYGVDRTSRELAIPSERPPGKLRDLQTALQAYRKDHAKLLDYVKETKDDLRAHFVERQRCDAYQWALLISTHEQRHVLQIREIKKDPRFPKR